MYTYIVINQNQFSIIESETKLQQDGSALLTINRIEQVLRKKLTYSGEDDKYLKMNSQQISTHLREMANTIRKNFLKKSQSMGVIKRFFGSIDQKEKEIRAATNRIDDVPSRPVLPPELMHQAFGFLDAGALEQLTKDNIDVSYIEIKRAQKYGYQGRDLVEARKYIQKVFDAVQLLVIFDIIPKESVVFRGFWKVVDCEETLRNIRANEEGFKIHFNGKLKEFMDFPQHHPEKIKALLLLGADPNLICVYDEPILIRIAGLTNCVEIIELLIEKGADLNAINKYDVNALNAAASQKRKKQVEFLLKLGANPNSKNHLGFTALAYVVRWGEKELMAKLIEKGADPNIMSNSSLIDFSSKDSDTKIAEVLEILCRGGLKLDVQNSVGYTLLHKAAAQNKVKTVKVLLKYGANKNIRNHANKLPVMLTSNQEIRTLLVKSRAFLIRNKLL